MIDYSKVYYEPVYGPVPWCDCETELEKKYCMCWMLGIYKHIEEACGVELPELVMLHLNKAHLMTADEIAELY